MPNSGGVHFWELDQQDPLPSYRPSFFNTFLARFVPQSFIDQFRDLFSKLDQGSMITSKYESRFHELSGYVPAILPT